jgi:cytochrome c oxidase subunit 2
MRGRVIVDEPADFESWLAEQPTYADTLARPEGNAQAGTATYALCSACHGAQGEGNQALNAPKIAGAEPWYTRRQILNYQQGVRGSDPRDVFGMQMAPMARTLATPNALADVTAYIASLPDTAPAETVIGDPERGRKLYATCSVCHGREGQGVWGTNAPRLAGVDDWYLVRQLQNFREGIRGAHPQDFYGTQMGMMADSLRDEQAMNDLVAYINTF